MIPIPLRRLGVQFTETWLKGSGPVLTIGPDRPLVTIGCSIDPSKRADLANALRRGDLKPVADLAHAQAEAGAGVINVCVRTEGVEEAIVLPLAVRAVVGAVKLPVSVETEDPVALAAALEVCPGKPLVNAISAREHSLKEMLPLAKLRGAAVIALAVDEAGAPHGQEKRIEMAREVLRRCITAGIPREDVILNPAASSLAMDPHAARDALRAITHLTRIEQLNTTIGVHDVSRGPMGSGDIESMFAAMAAFAGVTSVMLDPLKGRGCSPILDLLLGRDGAMERYSAAYAHR